MFTAAPYMARPSLLASAIISQYGARIIDSIQPLGYFAVASLFTIASLRLRKRDRILSLGPICLLTILSLTSAHKISWPTGANSTFTSIAVFYVPYSIKLLALDEHAISPESSTHNWPLIDYYRTWNNPRALPVRLSLLDRSPPPSLLTRLTFAFHQLLKSFSLLALYTLLFRPLLTRTLSHTPPSSFSPVHELPFPFSFHSLLLQILLTLHWLLTALVALTLPHALLSILFTSPLFPLDHPSDWPPLFPSSSSSSSSPLTTAPTSLRAFWSSFWHQLPIPTYRAYALLITRRLLRLAPGSRAEKTIAPGLVFLMSGLSHAGVAWAVGDAAPERDVLFFMLNYAAVTVEVILGKARGLEGVRGWWRRRRLPGWVRRAVGLVWVFGVLVGLTPLWVYPKVRGALEREGGEVG